MKTYLLVGCKNFFTRNVLFKSCMYHWPHEKLVEIKFRMMAMLHLDVV